MGATLAWLGARDGLVRTAIYVTALAALLAILDAAARAALGPGAGLLGHTGPGRLVVCAAALLLAWAFHRTAARRPALGLRPTPGWRGVIARGWLFGIGGYLAYALLMRAGGSVEFRAPRSLADVAAAVPACAFAGIAIATTEEILFRGFLLRAVADALPRWPAVIVTGILFAFFHDLANPGDLLTEPADRMLFGGVFCLHVLLCAAAIRTRALHLGIGIHAGLVFGEALFRRLRLFDVVDDESWFLGLDGDPRRGFIAWGLFLVSAAIIPRLMGPRAMAAVADREAVAFAPSAPPWLARLVDRVISIGPRGEAACWLAIGATAVAIRLTPLLGIPFALLHDGSAAILGAAASPTALEPRGGWLLTWILPPMASGDPALATWVWMQHGAALLGIATMFLALRSLLGRPATVPLAVCALGCCLHGLPIFLAHHVLPGALQFALMALALSLWALRLSGGGPPLAFAAASLASLQGLNAFLAWPLAAVIVMRELLACAPGRRWVGAGASLLGAALPLVLAASLQPSAMRSYPCPSPQFPAIFASIAHVDPALGRAPDTARTALAHLLADTPAMSPLQRRSHFETVVYRRLRDLEPDPARRDALCLELTLAVVKANPAGACAAWLQQARALLCRDSDNTDLPGEPDIRRTARYTRKSTSDPGATIHEKASALVPKFEGHKAPRTPESFVWFLAILPPYLATTLLLLAAAARGTPPSRWLATGCLAIWVPALIRFTLVHEVGGRDLAGLLPIAMGTLSYAIAAAFLGAAASLTRK